MDEIIVDLQKITKRYKKHLALNDVDLQIGTGITGLLGPNGAGKTTLIKVLLNLVKITSGSGTVLGKQLGRDTREIRSQIGYMPEDDFYVSGLLGVEMVQLAARLSGMPATEAMRRSHEIMDFCGIEQERYRPVQTYSTGMRQKMKFAQAIVHDPVFLILDEPTSGLDPEERQKMLNRIKLLARKGKTVLISTHILHDVQAVCHQAIIMVNGEIKLCEKMEILQRPVRDAYFLKLADDPKLFMEKLQSENISHSLEQDGSIMIESPEKDFTKNLWNWAEEVKVGIRQLNTAHNSLEEIFLNAVKGEKNAHL